MSMGFFAAGAMGQAGGGGVYVGNTITKKAVSTGDAHVVSLGAYSAGDRLILQFCPGWGAAPTVTLPAGWTLVTNFTWFTRTVFAYRDMDGSEGVSATVNTGTNTTSLAVVHRIAAGGFNPASAPVISSTNGTSATPDPPSRTVSWPTEATIWIATFFAQASAVVSVYPLPGTQTNDSVSNIAFGSCWEQIAVSPLDPTAFTIGASRDWQAYTIGIRPA